MSRPNLSPQRSPAVSAYDFDVVTDTPAARPIPPGAETGRDVTVHATKADDREALAAGSPVLPAG